MHSLQGSWPRPYSIIKAPIKDMISKHNIKNRIEMFFLSIIYFNTKKIIPIIIKINAVIINDHLVPFFSKKGPNFSPNLYVKKATKKNLEPLVKIQINIKKIKLKWMKPLEIVNSLKGKGVNPAVTNIPSQEKKPPFVENLSFKKLGSS